MLNRNLGRDIEDNWYMNLNFFLIHTDSGDKFEHWTSMNKEQLLNSTERSPLMILESGLFYEFRTFTLNTKCISTIECITEKKRSNFQSHFSGIEYKLQVVNRIREIKKTFSVKALVYIKELNYKKSNIVNYKKGSHLDPLMGVPLWQLESMLFDCVELVNKKDSKKNNHIS